MRLVFIVTDQWSSKRFDIPPHIASEGEGTMQAAVFHAAHDLRVANMPKDTWPEGLPETGVLWRRDVFAAADRWRAGRESVRAARDRLHVGQRAPRIRAGPQTRGA